MSKRVIVLDAADLDLEDQAAFIAQDNPDAGKRFLTAATRAFEGLVEMPRKGPAHPVQNRRLKGLRMWRVPGFKKHLIFYRPTEEGIEIVRVVHGARDVKRVLEVET